MSCRGKLVVHVAENGHSYRLECNECNLVEAVQKLIELMCGISINDQLLFCSDLKLESKRPLSDYKVPSDEREVFLFNKARMRSHSPHPAPEQVEFVNIPDDPPLPSSSHYPHPLDDASDPALKALPSYERQFIYHFQYGDAIFSRTTAKFETCKRLLQEQKVQERALEIARGNLDRLYKVIHQNYYTGFVKCYSRLHHNHTNLLANFGRDIEKLRSIKLPPPLQSAQIKCLLDFVKEENLHKSWEECSSSHKQYENKVSVFNLDFIDLKSSAEHILSDKPSFVIEDLELSIKDHQCCINEQKSIMQALSKDVDTVKKLVEDCLSSQMSSSLRPHDAVSALGPMYDSHEKSYLPKMLSCEREISSLLDSCRDKKNKMNTFVHVFMQKIAHVQGTIKDLCCKFSVLQEALKQLNIQFEQLKVLHGIGPAYRSCLSEVVKRKAEKKIYMAKAEQLVEKLASERDAEVRRREEFLKVHSAYIPRDILASMGLFDIPNPCIAHIAPFDSNLLDIGFSGLERYAPESSLGLSSKSKKHASLRSSLSISNDDSRADEVEGSVEFPEKYDYQEFLEGSELVEIGSTSKMEIENAKLKAELASKIALICSMSVELDYESLDDSKLDSILKNAADKTTEALHLKDEYEKHLQLMLKMKQMECESYQKRIHELEHKLSDQYMRGCQLSADKHVPNFVVSTTKTYNNQSEVLGVGEVHMHPTVKEFSCASTPLKSVITDEHDKPQEGLDDNMMDTSSMINCQLDSSMLDLHCDTGRLCSEGNKTASFPDSVMALGTSNMTISMSHPPDVPSCETAILPGMDAKVSDRVVMELQNSLAEKSSQLCNAETKNQELIDKVSKMGRELDINRKILGESQMKCAHLKNCLHEAREEAQSYLCAAERRASEYGALCIPSIKMHGLFESLRRCVSSVGMAAISDSLCALAQSLASESDDEGCAEFRECIQILADKVGLLSRQHTQLLERSSKAEDENEQLIKELVEKELAKLLQVHEIAAFVLNSSGHYEATNRACPRHYLSDESVALFSDNPATHPSYIVGQVVRIEGKIVKATPPPSSDEAENQGSSSNLYGLPVGCEYFVVTVAMLPDSGVGSPPS
ncbi:hypothetical protein ACS0TY_021523 [Phlomoides rotata]